MEHRNRNVYGLSVWPTPFGGMYIMSAGCCCIFTRWTLLMAPEDRPDSVQCHNTWFLLDFPGSSVWHSGHKKRKTVDTIVLFKKTKCLSKRHAPLSCVIKTTKGRKVDPSSSSSWWKERRLSSRKDTKELNLYGVQSTVELSLSSCILAYSLNEGGKKR